MNPPILITTMDFGNMLTMDNQIYKLYYFLLLTKFRKKLFLLHF